MTHRPVIEFIQQRPDGPVQLGQAEEGPGRHHGQTIMLSKILVSGVDIWLVAVGALHPRFEVVGHQDLRPTPQESQGPHMGPNPIGQALGPVRFDIGVVAGPQDGHEDLCLPDPACFWVHHRCLLTRIIDKQLLPGLMFLAHHRVELFGPMPVVVAELAVAIALGMFLPVLYPQQAQGHALAAQLFVHRRPIRLGGLGPGSGSPLWKQQLLQGLVTQPLW
jgi:hypothetical protein